MIYRLRLFEKYPALALLLIITSIASGLSAWPVSSAPAHASPVASPEVIFWSWYHDDDLRAAPGKVACLTNRILVDGGKIKEMPRLNKLTLRPHTERIAVVRLDVRALPEQGNRPALVKDLTERIIASTVRGRGKLDGLQIDYDATLDQRQFYLQLMQSLRANMPAGLPLSMTALASWCMADRWLDKSKISKCVDFVVPMLFTMGDGREACLHYLSKNNLKPPIGPLCVGFSLDDPEPLQVMIKGDKLSQVQCIYFFCSKPWTKERVDRVLNNLNEGKNRDRRY